MNTGRGDLHSGTKEELAGMVRLRRRGFLKLAGAMSSLAAPAMRAGARGRLGGPGERLPTRGEYVIRRGHVLTMEGDAKDYPVADVHVRDGEIVAIGPDLHVAGAPAVSAENMIVMPGFVDTHSHLWNAMFKGAVRRDDPVNNYMALTNRASGLCTPEDTYNSVLYGIAQELLSGVTSINNFSHNTRSPRHADAEIRAMLDSGIRGRFSYGPPGRLEPDRPIDMEDVARVQGQWLPGNPLLTLGINLLNPPPAVLRAGGDFPVFTAQIIKARERGWPVSLHYGYSFHGMVEFMEKRGLLGPDILLIHCQGFTAEERQSLVANRVKLSTSPVIEISYCAVPDGLPQFVELDELGAQQSLSIDASSAGNADFFNVMRALLWSQWMRPEVMKKKPTPRRIVEVATIEGARALNLDSQVGSLKPGKRADIVLVRRTDPNIAPVVDPYNSFVYSGLPSNVDTVIVDGRILVRGGQFTSLDIEKVVQKASASAERIVAEGNAVLRKDQAAR